MITRLYAMYQRSRKMLIFLVVTFVAVMITCRANAAIGLSSASWSKSKLQEGSFNALGSYVGEVFVLSGIYCCVPEGGNRILTTDTWILTTLWEILALCLAIWVAIKHIRELRRSSTGLTTMDSLTVLSRTQTQAFYFAA
jgi:hypothetical protein